MILALFETYDENAGDRCSFIDTRSHTVGDASLQSDRHLVVFLDKRASRSNSQPVLEDAVAANCFDVVGEMEARRRHSNVLDDEAS